MTVWSGKWGSMTNNRSMKHVTRTDDCNLNEVLQIDHFQSRSHFLHFVVLQQLLAQHLHMILYVKHGWNQSCFNQSTTFFSSKIESSIITSYTPQPLLYFQH